jgi:D-glycero-D-manno-heptose 1,7-bisphosphate phosphatase
MLASCGYALIGITNQPDVARGTQRREIVEAINTTLIQALPLDAIYVCYHDNRDKCDCRKPKPGLLIQAAHERELDLSQSFMVGDRWSDVVAGQAAGCRSLLIDTEYNERHRCAPHLVVADLLDAAQYICAACSDTLPGRSVG